MCFVGVLRSARVRTRCVCSRRNAYLRSDAVIEVGGGWLFPHYNEHQAHVAYLPTSWGLFLQFRAAPNRRCPCPLGGQPQPRASRYLHCANALVPVAGLSMMVNACVGSTNEMLWAK